MTTFRYLKQGPMGKRPFHLIAEDGITSRCGQVAKGDEGAMILNRAPAPVDDSFLCGKCAALVDLLIDEAPDYV